MFEDRKLAVAADRWIQAKKRLETQDPRSEKYQKYKKVVKEAGVVFL